MDTLYDLTKKRSGIVLHRGRSSIVCDDWMRISGVPRRIGGEVIGLGEPVRKIQGHYDDDLQYWLRGVDIGTRPQPYRGFVYQDGDDLVIIAPDEWP